MSKLSLLLLTTGLILLQVFFPFNTRAQGNLLITPKRVVFEGNKRSMDLNLANIGDDTATYAISLIQIRMTEEGGFETITEPDEGQMFASPYMRYFPRTVTLGPNEAQTVKIQLSKSGGLGPRRVPVTSLFQGRAEGKAPWRGGRGTIRSIVYLRQTNPHFRDNHTCNHQGGAARRPA